MNSRIHWVYVTRSVEFSAAHRLYREDLSETENVQIFGKCANPYGHGHNYLLEATFRGWTDLKSQMLIHFDSLKHMLNEVVVTPMDHRHLNYDVPFLEGILPTSENIVAYLWDRIQSAITGQKFELHRLKLSSSARNWVEYFGPQGKNHGT